MRIFKGLFTKSLLKQGLERQFQHIMTKKIKSAAFAVLFCVRYQLGRLPQNLTKGLFVKSPLESQKLSPK